MNLCLNRVRRRTFLTALPALSSLLRLEATAGDGVLHILPADSVERLRTAFNASRQKVRLLFLLSPT